MFLPCVDGICQRGGCYSLESCRSCPQDCGDCAWEQTERSSAGLVSVDYAAAARGDAAAGFLVVADGVPLRYDGKSWSPLSLPDNKRIDRLHPIGI